MLWLTLMASGSTWEHLRPDAYERTADCRIQATIASVEPVQVSTGLANELVLSDLVVDASYTGRCDGLQSGRFRVHSTIVSDPSSMVGRKILAWIQLTPTTFGLPGKDAFYQEVGGQVLTLQGEPVAAIDCKVGPVLARPRDPSKVSFSLADLRDVIDGCGARSQEP